jgi:hypothetical protein
MPGSVLSAGIYGIGAWIYTAVQTRGAIVPVITSTTPRVDSTTGSRGGFFVPKKVSDDHVVLIYSPFPTSKSNLGNINYT